MSSDESSELSSVPSEDESNLEFVKKDGILKFFSKAVPTPTASKPTSPPPPEREPSPPHEYVLADNPDIAVSIWFDCRVLIAFMREKSRCTTGFEEGINFFDSSSLCSVPASTRHSQNLYQILGHRSSSAMWWIVSLGSMLNNSCARFWDCCSIGSRMSSMKILMHSPGSVFELCKKARITILTSALDRPGHYNRALEEAVQTHKAQWAKDWESKNPLSGGATFTTMTPAQRVCNLFYYSGMQIIQWAWTMQPCCVPLLLLLILESFQPNGFGTAFPLGPIKG